MNLHAYFWNLSEEALAETEKILRDPAHPKFVKRMLTLLSRCDQTEDIFALLGKDQFAAAWPGIRKAWNQSAERLDFRDWWETIYEGILAEKGKPKTPQGEALNQLRLLGERIKNTRLAKGWSQKDLALRSGLKQADISLLESGKKNITLATLGRLNKVLESELLVLPPPGWPGDSLAIFLDHAERHIFHSFFHTRKDFDSLAQIDGLFWKLVMDAGAMTSNSTAGQYLRCFAISSHGAYRATCRMVLSGQVWESIMTLRGCLENALYALHIFKNPSALEVWLRRAENAESTKKCQNEFAIGKVKATLKSIDSVLHAKVGELYGELIDFSAHPNQLGIHARIIKQQDNKAVQVHYFALDSFPELHSVYRYGFTKTTEIGIMSLKILRLIFKDLFERLGLEEELQRLENGLKKTD
jgi:transcriptional regulator with XRE-family HTH domain